jgi:hypothetical protein
MATIEVSPVTRIFMLGTMAHNHVDSSKYHLRRYQKATKAMETPQQYRTAVEAIKEAKAELDQAVGNWETIEEILRLNPDLQEQA